MEIIFRTSSSEFNEPLNPARQGHSLDPFVSFSWTTMRAFRNGLNVFEPSSAYFPSYSLLINPLFSSSATKLASTNSSGL